VPGISAEAVMVPLEGVELVHFRSGQVRCRYELCVRGEAEEAHLV
jgi:hypothetical protein